MAVPQPNYGQGNHPDTNGNMPHSPPQTRGPADIIQLPGTSPLERAVENIIVVADQDVKYSRSEPGIDFNGYNLAHTSLGKALGLDKRVTDNAIFVVPYDGMEQSTEVRVETLRGHYGDSIAIVVVSPNAIKLEQNPGVEIPKDHYLLAAAQEHMTEPTAKRHFQQLFDSSNGI